MLESGQQDHPPDIRSSLVRHLIQALENCGDDGCLASAGRTLDERNVGRVQRDFYRILLLDSRRILEYLVANERREWFDLVRRSGWRDIALFLNQDPKLRIGGTTFEYRLARGHSSFNLCNFSRQREDERS